MLCLWNNRTVEQRNAIWFRRGKYQVLKPRICLRGLKSFNPPFYHPMKDKHSKKRLKTMDELDKDGEMSVEDVAWLTSLSETEIDMLISLKLLIIQRAKLIGYANLANKFDLKMIRVIAFVLMEHLKEEVKDSSVIPDTVKSAAFLDACNLLKCDSRVPATIEELSTNIGADIKTFLSSSPTSKRKKEEVRCRE